MTASVIATAAKTIPKVPRKTTPSETVWTPRRKWSSGWTSEPMRQASGDVFESWVTDLCHDFEALGMPAEKTRDVAVLCLMLVEGAFLLCRSWKLTEPMEIAGRAAVQAVEQALR